LLSVDDNDIEFTPCDEELCTPVPVDKDVAVAAVELVDNCVED